MRANTHEIISAGRAEAAKMRSAVAGSDAGARVTMQAGQFTVLAALIDNLCGIAGEAADGKLGDPRYWVPLEEYTRLKQSVAAPSLGRATFSGLNG